MLIYPTIMKSLNKKTMKFKITLSFTTAVILLFSFLFSNNLSAQIARPIKAKQGMVVSACSLASEVGINILKKGGNAVDASVA